MDVSIVPSMSPSMNEELVLFFHKLNDDRCQFDYKHYIMRLGLSNIEDPIHVVIGYFNNRFGYTTSHPKYGWIVMLDVRQVTKSIYKHELLHIITLKHGCHLWSKLSEESCIRALEDYDLTAFEYQLSVTYEHIQDIIKSKLSLETI